MMTSITIRGYGKPLDGEVNGVIIWSWRQGKWLYYNEEPGMGTKFATRAEAIIELRRATKDCGDPSELRIVETA